MQDAIAQMKDYLVAFVERPHTVFSGLPVCPFAKKARITGALHFIVTPITVENLEPHFRDFAAGSQYQMILFLSPEELPYHQFMEILKDLRVLGDELGIKVFEGHPNSDYQVNGLFTRQDPIANVQIITKVEIDDAEAKLSKSRYYSKIEMDVLEDWGKY